MGGGRITANYGSLQRKPPKINAINNTVNKNNTVNTDNTLIYSCYELE